MLRSLLNHPIVKQARAAGEERVGKAVAQLFSGDRAGSAFQTVLAAAGEARQRLDRGLRAALDAAQVPSAQDVADLKRRLGEMEELLDQLAGRLARAEAGEDTRGAGDDEAPGATDGG
ncbi:MAG TPA: hypothetical protein VMT17_08540 [Anaeromyxobacteraceae bacterium]|nr:hypothetical protein [Anaeromyxobacteraceae bacterium]